MANASFTKLNLKADTSVKTITFNEVEIEIKQYLPISEKKELVELCIQNSTEEGTINPVLVGMFFSLYACYSYTNLNFTDKQREDEFKLFDLLETSGLLSSIFEAIPKEELDFCKRLVDEYKKEKTITMTSFAGVADRLLGSIPQRIQQAAIALEDFDMDKLKNVQSFMSAINPAPTAEVTE